MRKILKNIKKNLKILKKKCKKYKKKDRTILILLAHDF